MNLHETGRGNPAPTTCFARTHTVTCFNGKAEALPYVEVGLKGGDASGADGGVGGVGADAFSEIPASFALLVLRHLAFDAEVLYGFSFYRSGGDVIARHLPGVHREEFYFGYDEYHRKVCFVVFQELPEFFVFRIQENGGLERVADQLARIFSSSLATSDLMLISLSHFSSNVLFVHAGLHSGKVARWMLETSSSLCRIADQTSSAVWTVMGADNFTRLSRTYCRTVWRNGAHGIFSKGV